MAEKLIFWFQRLHKLFSPIKGELMRIHRIPLVLAVLISLTLNLKAGRLDQQLADKISAAQPEEQISVLIQMAAHVDLPGLEAELQAKKADIAETHRRV